MRRGGLVTTMSPHGRRRAISTQPNVCGWTISSDIVVPTTIADVGLGRAQTILESTLQDKPSRTRNFAFRAFKKYCILVIC